MATSEPIEETNIVKERDAANLLNRVLARYKRRPAPETIIEIGSNTCKTTLKIAKKFPNSRVIGIESDSSLFEFSRGSHCKEQKNMLFILANIGQTSFWSQVQAQASDLKEGSVDLIISTHTLRMTDPNFDIALDHIFKMLKPDGQFFATISLWSDLFEIEKRIALQRFPEILTQSQRASNLITLMPPNRQEEKTRLKELLRNRGFGDSPELVNVYCHIKFNRLKKVQDAIRWMCPFGSCMPDSSRLRFYGQFFEKIYDEYFGNRYSVHAFEYEYMSVVATKLVK